MPTPSTIPTPPRRAAIYFRADQRGAGRQGLRRLVDGCDRARLAFEPLGRGARLPDEPDRARARAAIFNSYPAGPCRGRLPRACVGASPTCGRSSSPAAASAASSARARRCGRATSPRAGTTCATRSRPASTCRCRAFPTGPTTSAASRSRSGITKQDPDASRRMARALPALVPVRRLHAAVPQPRRVPVPRDYEIAAGRPGDVRGPGLLPPPALPPAALHLHARRRHLARRRHDHARAGDGFRRRPPRVGHRRPVHVRARPCSSRRSPSSRRAAREVYLPAGAAWYDFDTGRASGGRDDPAAAPRERMPLFVRAGSIVPIGPAIQIPTRTGRRPLTLHVYTGADGASRSTRMTAPAASIGTAPSRAFRP